MGEKTSFYKSEELEKVLTKYTARYGSVSKAVTNLVLGVDTMYRIERRVLKELFTQQEINLMLNNALSTAYNPLHTTDVVYHDTQDEIQTNFDYFGVDKNVILKKLKGLTVSQQYALVDLLLELRGDDPIEEIENWIEDNRNLQKPLLPRQPKAKIPKRRLIKEGKYPAKKND